MIDEQLLNFVYQDVNIGNMIKLAENNFLNWISYVHGIHFSCPMISIFLLRDRLAGRSESDNMIRQQLKELHVKATNRRLISQFISQIHLQ